ncbi:uncharacterized protein LOC123217205 isoform X3 [Mangifera indica]|uniref:uncharacterized protein LOC123217205 isoform X3 n=1 Tax=Mangifera indica TaxID=29780 RepID=UPI001CFBAF5D|nr:uncharacterized protein LOC123217205 isoform X3 [Mangifera indica]
MRTSVSDMRDYVVCPKPRRLGVLHSTFNDPQPVRSLRWSLSHQSEALDSRAASDLFDIIIPKFAGVYKSFQTITPNEDFWCMVAKRKQNIIMEEREYSWMYQYLMQLLLLGIRCGG